MAKNTTSNSGSGNAKQESAKSANMQSRNRAKNEGNTSASNRAESGGTNRTGSSDCHDSWDADKDCRSSFDETDSEQ